MECLHLYGWINEIVGKNYSFLPLSLQIIIFLFFFISFSFLSYHPLSGTRKWTQNLLQGKQKLYYWAMSLNAPIFYFLVVRQDLTKLSKVVLNSLSCLSRYFLWSSCLSLPSSWDDRFYHKTQQITINLCLKAFCLISGLLVSQLFFMRDNFNEFSLNYLEQ